MKSEEAKKIIFNQWQSFLEDNIDYGGISEAYKMAMKALEQQPSDSNISDPCDGCRYELNSTNGNPCYSCGKYKLTEQQPSEDCISRQAVINTIFYKSDNTCDVVLSTDLMDRIKHLPSVTPQPKKGKWIYKWMKGQFCSECDEQSVWKFNYCPNCGAYMRGEEDEVGHD